MNKLNLSALLLSVLTVQTPAHAAPMFDLAPQAPYIVNTDDSVYYTMFYTEANWQRIRLPAQALEMLGDLANVSLTVSGLPPGVTVELGSRNDPAGTIALKITRQAPHQPLHQLGTFTLSAGKDQPSYRFQALVVGGPSNW